MNFFAVAPGVMKTKMFFKTNLKKLLKNYSKNISFTNPSENYDLIKMLIYQNNNKLSGKLLSVKWDEWKNLKFIKRIQKNEDTLTLRRKI